MITGCYAKGPEVRLNTNKIIIYFCFFPRGALHITYYLITATINLTPYCSAYLAALSISTHCAKAVSLGMAI